MNPLGTKLNRGPYRVLATVIGEVTDTPAGNVALRVGKETEPHGPWEQTDYIILTPGETDTLITELIGALGEPSILPPLVVIDITGGVVQGENLYPGTGKPVVIALDFDRSEADLEEVLDFQKRVEETATLIEVRIARMTDFVEAQSEQYQLTEWRQQAALLVEDRTPTPSIP